MTPSVESITEFAVDTNGFKAEYGQAGGGVITFASKSGSNEFHGTAYEFLRNDDVDARGFFAPTRSIYKQTISAHRPADRLLFLSSTTVATGHSSSLPTKASATGKAPTGYPHVPTPEMYSGDFSNWVNSKGSVIPIYDPATTQANPPAAASSATPFPGNQIPVSRFSAVSNSTSVRETGVAPNRPGIVPGTIGYVSQQLRVTAATPKVHQQGQREIDQNFGSNHHVNFFYNRTRLQLQPGSLRPVRAARYRFGTGRSRNTTLTLYRDELRLDHFPADVQPFLIRRQQVFKKAFAATSGKNWKSKVCILNAVDCNVNFPEYLVLGTHGLGRHRLQRHRAAAWSLKNDLSYIRGAHNIKFGYTFESQERMASASRTSPDRRALAFWRPPCRARPAPPAAAPSHRSCWALAIPAQPRPIRYLPQTYRYHGFLRAGRLAHQQKTCC